MIEKANNDSAIASSDASAKSRYFQLFLLLLAAGAIYPIIYLRQNFELTILDSFQITIEDLSNYYSLLGIIYIICYVPSGWLADKFSPKILITFSLAMTASLGLWFATIPSKDVLPWIFTGWGISAGLTFWAALIKGINILAKKDEQGRFFGVLDGGRGLVEAVLATIAVTIFSLSTNANSDLALEGIKNVIWFYAGVCFLLAIVVFVFVEGGNESGHQESDSEETRSLLADLKLLATTPKLWLVAAIIFCGWQLYWATFSFSAFIQEGFGLTAVVAGTITVANLWLRPISGIGSGFLGDKIGKENVLLIGFIGAATVLTGLILSPQLQSTKIMIALIFAVGFLCFSIRALYWSVLEDCDVPYRVTGLAVGVISLIAYTPDVISPQVNSYFAARYDGVAVYQHYFAYVVVTCILGAVATLIFKRLNSMESS